MKQCNQLWMCIERDCFCHCHHVCWQIPILQVYGYFQTVAVLQVGEKQSKNEKSCQMTDTLDTVYYHFDFILQDRKLSNDHSTLKQLIIHMGIHLQQVWCNLMHTPACQLSTCGILCDAPQYNHFEPNRGLQILYLKQYREFISINMQWKYQENIKHQFDIVFDWIDVKNIDNMIYNWK